MVLDELLQVYQQRQQYHRTQALLSPGGKRAKARRLAHRLLAGDYLTYQQILQEEQTAEDALGHFELLLYCATHLPIYGEPPEVCMRELEKVVCEVQEMVECQERKRAQA